MKILFISILFLIASSCIEDVNTKNYTFESIRINNQDWMTTNLDVSRFRNGDLILHAKTDEEWKQAGTNKQPAWCYYDNEKRNGRLYGKLYNWYAVSDAREIAPIGWHVPSDLEWSKLIDYLGGEDYAGEKLKSKDGWFKNGVNWNESGFSALPGGYRSPGGFDGLKTDAIFWSSTEEKNDYSWNREMFYGNNSVTRFNYHNWHGFSVRCIKD
jgi:uncharacterized protein (TIGR02145 family)